MLTMKRSRLPVASMALCGLLLVALAVLAYGAVCEQGVPVALKRSGLFRRWQTEQLISAIRRHDNATVRDMLARTPELVEWRDSGGGTPLISTVRADNVGAAQLLLQYGADPDARWSGETALHIAAREDNDRIFATLLAGGADLRAGTPAAGHTAVHLAAQMGSVHIIRYFCTAHPESTGLLDRYGDSLLGCAAAADQYAVVKAMLAAGVDANMRDAHGNTPLFFAEDSSIAAALLAAGADVHARNQSGDTPLICIAAGLPTDEKVKLFKLLIAQGADVNARNAAGWTALHGAVFIGEPGPVRALLRLGADPEIKDTDGRSAEEYARSLRHREDVIAVLRDWRPTED